MAASTPSATKLPFAKATLVVIFLLAILPNRAYSQEQTHTFKIVGDKFIPAGVLVETGMEVQYDSLSSDHIYIIKYYKSGAIKSKTRALFLGSKFRLLEIIDYINKKTLFIDGKQIDYRENGIPESELMYEKGNPGSRTLFYPDGKKQMSFGGDGNTINGELKIWSQAGQLSFLGNYKNNLKDGECQTYNPDGSIERKGTYKDGTLVAGVPVVEDLLYDKPDEPAHFSGGDQAFDVYLKEKSENFLNQKKNAAKDVTIDLVVGNNGKISNEKDRITATDESFQDHLKDGAQNSLNEKIDSTGTKYISIKLIVDKDGNVSDKAILTNTNLLEKEIINAAILQIPPFVPATVEGVPVRSILKVYVMITAKGLQLCTPENIPHGQVFFIVEDMPEFPGGVDALQRFIGQSIRYPVSAQQKGITGKVFVNFVVAEDGSVQNVKIARGVDPALDAEAVRVIKSLPKWISGKQRGKPVAVAYTVPINFNLQ